MVSTLEHRAHRIGSTDRQLVGAGPLVDHSSTGRGGDGVVVAVPGGGPQGLPTGVVSTWGDSGHRLHQAAAGAGVVIVVVVAGVALQQRIDPESQQAHHTGDEAEAAAQATTHA